MIHSYSPSLDVISISDIDCMEEQAKVTVATA